MSCGCQGQTKERASYENTKNLAKIFAQSQKVTVVIFRTNNGYSFMDADCPEASEITPVEYISALE